MTRKLRPGERELWDQVARTADPLRPATDQPAPDAPTPKTPKRSTPKTPSAPKPIAPFSLGSKTATRVPEPAAKPAPSMDAKAYSKMKKGRLAPEGRIDLHGMTTSQAHPELINFILRSHQKGRRLVLVITGKGEGSGERGPLPYQRGILRRQVPHWLTQAPIGGLILQVTPASPRHGGDGALYVYLRRNRS